MASSTYTFTIPHKTHVSQLTLRNAFPDNSNVINGTYRANMADARALDEKVVVKKLTNDKEYQLLNLCQSSYVVKCIDYHVDLSGSFLVMEDMEIGLDEVLDGLLKAHQTLPHVEIYKITFEIASALMKIHDKRIVHRDIKPSNILLDANYTAKLADFGCSASMDDAEDNAEIYRGTPGTADYMAPELYGPTLDDVVPATEKSDIYSLGMTMLVMCYGFSIIEDDPAHNHFVNLALKLGRGEEFTEEEYQAFLTQVPIRKDVSQLVKVPDPRRCPIEYFNLILRCCAPKPDARPTALELVAEITKLRGVSTCLDKKSDGELKPGPAAPPVDKTVKTPDSSSAGVTTLPSAPSKPFVLPNTVDRFSLSAAALPAAGTFAAIPTPPSAMTAPHPARPSLFSVSSLHN